MDVCDEILHFLKYEKSHEVCFESVCASRHINYRETERVISHEGFGVKNHNQQRTVRTRVNEKICHSTNGSGHYSFQQIATMQYYIQVYIVKALLLKRRQISLLLCEILQILKDANKFN